MAAVESEAPALAATSYEECLRQCQLCRVGASNALRATFIYSDPLGNIPITSHPGALETLASSFNVRSRESKRRRFGFSSSEDAVTWVVFTYLLRSGQLVKSLRQANLTSAPLNATPAVLLWGVPVDDGLEGPRIRARLTDLCLALGETATAFSEPDVIVDFGEDGILFVEVKHRSGNDWKSAAYGGWQKYLSAASVHWNAAAVAESGAYELARNWCLMNLLARGRESTLVNLGPKTLFQGEEGERLSRFVDAIEVDDRHRFASIAWPDLIGDLSKDGPEWFAKFCSQRRLA